MVIRTSTSAASSGVPSHRTPARPPCCPAARNCTMSWSSPQHVRNHPLRRC